MKLTAIHCYPIKSCAGSALDQARLDEFGVEHDRRWLVTDPACRFLSQRDWPRMALIRPTVLANGLRLSAPGMEPLVVPSPAQQAPQRQVTVWHDHCIALDAGEGAAQWLSSFLGMSCRLARMGPQFQRPVNAQYAVGHDQVSFADGFPFLLASSASLEDLNARLPEPVPMNRFRPNLVVSGAQPFAEDGWAQIRIGDVVFHAVKPCARCTVTTVDQGAGVRGKEPLVTLATYRKTNDGLILFGQNLIHHPKEGRLRVGDRVEVMQTKA